MKTKIVFALVAFLMLGSVNLNAQENGNSQNSESTTSLEGDLNNDGKVDAADITYLVNIIMNIEKSQVDPNQIPVTGVSISPTSATLTSIGATKQLTVTVSPSTATNKTYTLRSSNQAIATVSSNGLVTAKAAGTANITVETEDGGYTATCAITVSPIPQTTFYWYVGRESDGIPTSFSNVQTDKTAPGWHEIGTTLNGYNYNFDDTDKTVVLSTTTQTYKYYIIIPTGLHMTDIFNTNYELESVGEFVPVNCSITGYKAFKSSNAVRKVWGLILKQ